MSRLREEVFGRLSSRLELLDILGFRLELLLSNSAPEENYSCKKADFQRT